MDSKRVSAGNILIAQPYMNDGNFKRSVVGLTEHNQEGTVGFVLNKPMNIKLDELVNGINTEEEFTVNYGGPVSKDTIHYIHNVGDLLEESILVKKGIYWGGNFDKLLFLIESGLITKKNIKFYVGYSGWSEGQLDAELLHGSWIVSEWYANYAFQSKASELWKQAMSHKGDAYSVLAQIPIDNNNN